MAERRSDGERIRIAQSISRLRASLDALELALRVDAPPSPSDAQTVAHTAVELAYGVARLEAYLRAEEDAR